MTSAWPLLGRRVFPNQENKNMMKTGHNYNFWWLALPAFLLAACECLEPEPPITEENFPDPFWVDSFDYNYEFREASILFNKPVDPESLIPGQTLIIGGTDIGYSGYFDLELNNTLLVIPECEIVCLKSIVMTAPPPCDDPATLTLKGDPGNAILSMEGQILDGDGNVEPGGDYTASFVIASTCWPQPSRVESPEYEGDQSALKLDDSNHLYFDVLFNPYGIDTNTVVPDNSFLLSLVVDPNWDNPTPVSGVISWRPGSKSFRFISKDRYNVCRDSTCFLLLELIGNNPNPIRNVFGLALDGDNSGMEGGNFITNMRYQP